jgi:hypothetical protein
MSWLLAAAAGWLLAPAAAGWPKSAMHSLDAPQQRRRVHPAFAGGDVFGGHRRFVLCRSSSTRCCATTAAAAAAAVVSAPAAAWAV